jgi:hypothetical protein
MKFIGCIQVMLAARFPIASVAVIMCGNLAALPVKDMWAAVALTFVDSSVFV